MELEEELRRDVELLERVEAAGQPAFRTWTFHRPAVVMGRGSRIAAEVDTQACSRLGIPVLRRASGGGAVVVGPGTLQWAFALPHALSVELATIAGCKRLCNRILITALAAQPGARTLGRLTADESGDLMLGDRKVGGIALKRRRRASLVHGTILTEADLDVIDLALPHPPREPAYRAGRCHRDFLASTGPIDRRLLEQAVAQSLQALVATPHARARRASPGSRSEMSHRSDR